MQAAMGCHGHWCPLATHPQTRALRSAHTSALNAEGGAAQGASPRTSYHPALGGKPRHRGAGRLNAAALLRDGPYFCSVLTATVLAVRIEAIDLGFGVAP